MGSLQEILCEKDSCFETATTYGQNDCQYDVDGSTYNEGHSGLLFSACESLRLVSAEARVRRTELQSNINKDIKLYKIVIADV